MSNSRGRGRPKHSRPDGMTEEEFRKARQRKYNQRHQEKIKGVIKKVLDYEQQDREDREYFAKIGLARELRQMDEEVMEATGDFIEIFDEID